MDIVTVKESMAKLTRLELIIGLPAVCKNLVILAERYKAVNPQEDAFLNSIVQARQASVAEIYARLLESNFFQNQDVNALDTVPYYVLLHLH
jgi:hypothetical protein